MTKNPGWANKELQELWAAITQLRIREEDTVAAEALEAEKTEANKRNQETKEYMAIRNAAIELYAELQKRNAVKVDDQSADKLISAAKQTAQLLQVLDSHQDPLPTHEGVTKLLEDYRTTAKQLHAVSWGKVVGGIMLALVAAAVVVLASLFVAATLGAAAPLVGAGIVAGATAAMTPAGAAAVGAAGGVLGLAGLVGSGALFASSSARDKRVKAEMRAFEKAAHVFVPKKAALGA